MCQGVAGGWAMDLPVLSLGVRGAACRGGYTTPFLDATNDQLGAELRALFAWDLRTVTLSAGPLVGASLLFSRFDAMTDAPPRTSLAGIVGLSVAGTLDIADRVYLSGELDGIVAFFREQRMSDVWFRAAFPIRVNLLVGHRW